MSKRSTKAVDAAPAIRTSKSKRKVPNLMEKMLGAQGLTSAFASDMFTNAAARSGWGTNSLAQGTSYELIRFSYSYWDLITLYRNHWVSRKIVDIPAQDCVKAWPKLTSDIEPKDLTKLDRALRKTNTKNNILTAITWARLFGGAGALMIIDGQGDQLDEPLDLDSVGIGSFKGVLPFDRWTGLTPVGDVCTDITRPLDFNKPEMYEVRTKGGGSFKVHSSRLLRFLGPSVPAPEDGAQSYWGISVLEPIYEAITKVDNASFNILNLTFRANLLGIEFPQLEQILSGVGGTQEANKRLEQRLSAVNAMMSSQSLILLPKDGKLEATSYTFSGLAEVYQLFQLELSGGSGIPVTRLWGRTYSGLGGTANEGDEKVYDEKIASDQATYVLPQLEKMYPVLCMSELGEVPDDLDLICPSIRVLDEKEKAELAKATADTLVVYMNGGIMSPRVVGKEVKQSSGLTGVGTNLTNEDIEKLSDKVQAEGEMGEGLFGEGKGGLSAASGPSKALKEEDKAGKEKLQEVPEDEDEAAVAPVGTAPAMDALPAGLKPGSKVDVNGKQLTVRKVTTGTHDLFGEPTVQVAFTTGEVVAYSVPERAEDAQVDEDAKVVAQVLKVNGKTAAVAKVRELTTGQPAWAAGALFDKALAILIPGNDRTARLARNARALIEFDGTKAAASAQDADLREGVTKCQQCGQRLNGDDNAEVDGKVVCPECSDKYHTTDADDVTKAARRALLAAGYGPRVLVARSSKGGLDVFAEHDSSEAVSRDEIQSILKRNGLPAAATIDLSSRRGATDVTLTPSDRPLKWNVLVDGRPIGTVAETQARTGQKMYDATSTSGKTFRGRTRKDAVEQLEKVQATDADGSSTKHADMMLYHALPVRIETPKGGTRSGPGWTHTLPADYGFIDMGINGADGDSIDAYVGPDPESSNVYVIDQYKLDGKSWDEHKVMLAYPTQEAAVADYMAGHHKSDRVFAAVTAFTMPHFRKWLSHHDMTQPCDPSVEVRPWA